METVFWHNVLSPHQSSFTRALANSGVSVTVVAAEAMSADRQRMGWRVPDFGPAEVIITTASHEIDRLVQTRSSAIHVLAGARWQPLGKAATRACIRAGCRMGIMSECADFRGVRGIGRWIKYSLERLRDGRYFDFVLAMGETGVRWFRACGYPPSRLFPFAYFTETPDVRPPSNSDRGRPFVITFVGRCVVGKGLEDLLRALRSCMDLTWRLRILGDGPLNAFIQAEARQHAFENRAEVSGFLSNELTLQQLSECDLLVLPSNGKEGWGAVINEALMVGVPVLCSARCGAADLIRHPELGEVFATGSVAALTAALRRRITEDKPSPALRRRIQAWSRCISGQAGASYFREVLAHAYEKQRRPEAPWRQDAIPQSP